MAVQIQTNNLALTGPRCSRLTAIKTEPNPAEPGPTGDCSGRSPYSESLGAPSNSNDPYQVLSDRILNFFYPPTQYIEPHFAGMNLYFSPDNIHEFLDQYTHFHFHMPVLHLSTFRYAKAYPGLLSAMCCVGACYSERVAADDVRQMMDFQWAALDKDCKYLSGGSKDDEDVEQLQAVLITAILNLWNGAPQQRQRARHAFSVLSDEARRLGLLTLLQPSQRQSPCHHASLDPGSFHCSDYDWPAWIEQESRIRLMMSIFLGDVAMGLYFNSPFRIEPSELQIPLPCDDAAWNAQDGLKCLSALGLRGGDSAREANPFGTRRTTQPEAHQVLSALLYPSAKIQPGSTNVRGKLILVHALLMRTLQAHRGDTAMLGSDEDNPLTGDWVNLCSGDSERSGPVVDAAGDVGAQSLQALSAALDKLKHCWDADKALQLPVETSDERPSFTDDDIHLYWLAQYILKHTSLDELFLPADVRFPHVISLVKAAKAWVLSGGPSRGEELDSIGEDIVDGDYGTTDLTLDMATLFRPLSEAAGYGGKVSVKTEQGNMGG